MWRRIVGIVVPDSIVGRRAPPPDGGCDIGVTCAMGAPAPWSAAGGQAEVNLDNGKLTFTVHGLVLADDFNGVNIGTPTVVTEGQRHAGLQRYRAGIRRTRGYRGRAPKQTGNARFSGRVDLPPSCTDEPEDMVFVIRIADVSEFEELIDMWNAFGAGRVIRHPDR